jgi:hypothetical protein
VVGESFGFVDASRPKAVENREPNFELQGLEFGSAKLAVPTATKHEVFQTSLVVVVSSVLKRLGFWLEHKIYSVVPKSINEAVGELATPSQIEIHPYRGEKDESIEREHVNFSDIAVFK